MAGIISTQTIQVGKALVKTFGEGANFRKFVTEVTESGKTLTKVYDSNGRELISRIKAIESEAVGDKLVKTKKTAMVENIYNADGDSTRVLSKGVKEHNSRVYDAKGNLLGGRIISWWKNIVNDIKDLGKESANPLASIKPKDYLVSKYSGKWNPHNQTLTRVNAGIRDERAINRRFIDLAMDSDQIAFNNKGLPIPAAIYDSGRIYRQACGSTSRLAKECTEGMSLKEMRKLATDEMHKINSDPNKGTWYRYGDERLSDRIFYPEQKMNIPPLKNETQSVQQQAVLPNGVSNLEKFL